MSLILKPITLTGSRGKQKVDALFDSGASYSCIRKDIAAEIATLDLIPEPMEFETAEENGIIVAHYRVVLDFDREEVLYDKSMHRLRI